MGDDRIRIGDVTGDHQQIVIATSGTFNGHGWYGGMLDLRDPVLTAVHNGTQPDRAHDSKWENNKTQIACDLVFTTMWKTGLSPPMFSMAFNRIDGSKDDH